MGNLRTQVAEPNVKFGTALPEVTKVDTYVRPATPPAESTVDPMAKFFAEISPSIQSTLLKKRQIDAEIKDQEILENAKQKRVSDVEEIFSSPEAFNTHVEDYNSLTLTAQRTLGQMYGAKLANKAINDIDDRSLVEHWEKYNPEQVQEVLKSAHGNVIANIQAKTPEAAVMPGFYGMFTDMMDKHTQQFLNEHSPKYGKYLNDTVKTGVEALVLAIAQNKQNTPAQTGTMIGTKLNELYSKVDPRGTYNFNQWAIDALIQTDNIKLLKAVRDGTCEINLGGARQRGDNKLLNKTVYAQTKLPDAIRALQKKQFEAHDEMHRMVDMRVQSVEMFTQQAMLSSTSMDSQGRPTLKGNVDTSYESYSRWYKGEFGDDGNMASRSEYSFGYAKGRRQVEQTLPMDGGQLDKGARTAAQIFHEKGPDAAAAYLRRTYKYASPGDLSSMLSGAKEYAIQTTEPVFKQGQERVEALHVKANAGLKDSGISQNYKVMGEAQRQYLSAANAGSVDEVLGYLRPEYHQMTRAILKKGNLSNLPASQKTLLLDMFEESYKKQHPGTAQLYQKKAGEVKVDNSDPKHPIKYETKIK
jgi:hypothetical protein